MSPRHPSALKLEHVLLALLDQKPMHGYELYQDLCEIKGISQIWHLKQAMLYATLDKLESRGFLYSQPAEEETYPPRKYFYPTEVGKDSLRTWLTTPVRRARDMRQEFLAKLIVTSWYEKSDMLALIHLQTQECQNWFDEMPVKDSPVNEDQINEWIVYSFRSNQMEELLNWLRICEQAVEQLPEGDYPARSL